jgi:alpha-tubulin suppressor-like RCC1 family protein
MPSSIYGLVHTNIPDRDLLVSSLKVDNSIKDLFSSNGDIDAFVNTLGTKYKQIGFIFDNTSNTIPFFDETAFGPKFEYFVTKSKIKGVVIFDIIACNFTSGDIEARVHELEKKLGVDIRYSVDRTSSLTNWVMESDDVDLRPIYFTDTIDTYTHMLGPSSSHMGFVVYDGGVKKVFMSGGVNLSSAKGLLSNVGGNYALFNGLTDIKQISTGADHSLYLKENGDVIVSGKNNAFGQCGLGSTGSDVVPPQQIPTLSGIIQIIAGRLNSLFLKENGDLFVCGRNNTNQLGINTSGSSIISITKINGIPPVRQIASGESFSLILDIYGDVYSTGTSAFGQLGLGDNFGKQTFTKIPTLTNIIQIGCSRDSSFFLKDTGVVFACGKNIFSNSSNASFNVPIQVSITNISKIACGFFHIIYFDKNGNLWASGDNSKGQYGNDTTISAGDPVKLAFNYSSTDDFLLNSIDYTIMDVTANLDTTFVLAKENDTNIQYAFGTGANSGDIFGEYNISTFSQQFRKVRTGPTTYLENVVHLADSQSTFMSYYKYLELLDELLALKNQSTSNIFDLTDSTLLGLLGNSQDANDAKKGLTDVKGVPSKRTTFTVALPDLDTNTIRLPTRTVETTFNRYSLFQVNVIYIIDTSFNLTYKRETVGIQVDLPGKFIVVNGNTDKPYGEGDRFSIGGQMFIVHKIGSLVLIPVPPPCFVKGSRILTPSGYRKVETLADGDFVTTANGKIVPVRVLSTMIGETSTKTAPFRIPKDFISRGVPSRDVGLSPDHAVMIKPGAWMFTKTLGRHLPEKVRQYNLGKSQTYYHVETPDYFKDDLVVEGMVVESYGINVVDRVDFVLSEEKGGLIRVDTQSVLNRNLRN